MHCFEIAAATVGVARLGEASGSSRVAYDIPEEAVDLLAPRLTPYGQHPAFYFDKLGFGRPPAPWAMACLDREYPLAGHVASSRSPQSGISFAPYAQVPNPQPADFVPGVGVITFSTSAGLADAHTRSPLFRAAWQALVECDPQKRWLVLLDPLPASWLAEVTPGDAERWRNRPR